MVPMVRACGIIGIAFLQGILILLVSKSFHIGIKLLINIIMNTYGNLRVQGPNYWRWIKVATHKRLGHLRLIYWSWMRVRKCIECVHMVCYTLIKSFVLFIWEWWCIYREGYDMRTTILFENWSFCTWTLCVWGQSYLTWFTMECNYCIHEEALIY